MLQQPCENAFGDDFDPRVLPDPGIVADAVPDRLADGLTYHCSHVGCGGAGGQSPGFQQHQFLSGQPGFMQQGQRDTRGFSRARLRRQ